MQVSASAPSSRPGTGAAVKRKRTMVRDTAATALISQTPVNEPPSLRDRQYSADELFHYYAMRGNSEVMHSAGAVQAALASQASAPSGSRVALSPSAAWSADVNGGARAQTATAAGRLSPQLLPASPVRPGTSPWPALEASAMPESGEPLFPRLRPSASEDARKSTFVQQAREATKRDALQTRKQNLALPSTEAYYGALYTPDAALTNHIREALEEGSKKKHIESAVAMEAIAALDGPTGGSPGGLGGGAATMGGKSARSLGATAGAAAADRSARHAGTGLNASMRSSSLQGGLAGLPPQPPLAPASSRGTAGFSVSAAMSGRRTPQLDLVDRGSPGLASGPVSSGRTFSLARLEDADQHAALLRESHAMVAKEVEDLFVATYGIQHPDALARKAEAEEAARRRQSARAASLAMATDATAAARRSTRSPSTSKKAGTKKSKKSTSAPLPPREGAPGPNLRLFLTSLIACADDQGRVSQAQYEAVLQGIPFEVMNHDALRDFFALVRQFSQAKQREIAFLAAGVGGSPQLYADSSIASTGSGPGLHMGATAMSGGAPAAQSMRSVVTGRSTAGIPGMSMTRLSVGSRGAGPALNNNNNNNNAGEAPLSTHNSTQYASLSGAAGAAAALPTAPWRPSPVVYLRELIGAVDELLNGAETRDVVRWISFNAFASSGQGYIHKATLANLRHQQREACEGPQAEITASMVKALGDCFDVIAREEEEAYLNGGGKGKKKSKKKKMPALAPHQKSIIPLSVMRVSHMNYATFCRFFEELPQVAASFSHVWLSLLFTGSIAPITPTTTSTSTAAAAATTTTTTTTITAGVPHQASVGEVSVGAGESFARGARSSYTGVVSSPSGAQAALSPRGEGLEEVRNEASGSLEREAGRRLSVSPSPTAVLNRQNWPQEILRGLEAPAVIEPGTYPLSLLGDDGAARRAMLQRVVVNRLECMKTGMEELENAQPLNLSQGRPSVQA